MSENKVYQPETIDDNWEGIGEDKSGEGLVGENLNKSGDSEVYSQTSQKDKPIPKKVIAHETINQSINTQQQRILGSYQFGQLGAIKIGDYEPEVSGDIRISPSGITARNSAGLDTFTLDGETGNATFRGTISAGDVTVVDDEGIISLSAFRSGGSSYTGTSSLSVSKAGSGFNAWDDVSASLEDTFELDRAANILLYFSCVADLVQDTAAPTLLQFRLLVNDTPIGGVTTIDATQFSTGYTGAIPLSMMRIVSVTPDVNNLVTLLLQWRINNGTGGIQGTTALGLDAGAVAAEIGYIALGR